MSESPTQNKDHNRLEIIRFPQRDEPPITEISQDLIAWLEENGRDLEFAAMIVRHETSHALTVQLFGPINTAEFLGMLRYVEFTALGITGQVPLVNRVLDDEGEPTDCSCPVLRTPMIIHHEECRHHSTEGRDICGHNEGEE